MNLTEKDILRIKKAFKGLNPMGIAKDLNSSYNTVIQVKNGFLQVSPKRALDFERVTKGAVKASVLRPDIFGKSI